MRLLSVFLFLCLPVLANSTVDIDLKVLPVQAGGRLQPFDTFAKDSLHFISGQHQFKKKPAVEIVLSWILFSQLWDQTELVYIREASLKKALELDIERLYFSPLEILQNTVFVQERVELHSRLRNKESLDTYFKALQKLENQLALYQAIQTQFVPGWVPPKSNDSEQLWLNLVQIKQEDKLYKIFQDIFSAYIALAVKVENKATKEDRQLVQQKFQEIILQFQQKMQERDPDYEKHLSKASTEVHYNNLNPFHWSWILYLLGLVFVGVRAIFKKKFLLCGFLSFTSIAFLLQGYGMLLRSLIMERPPVTNMYETVIWVPWVAVIIGFILWRLHKSFFVFVCSCVVALFCLLLADSAPSLLEGRLEPLEAVLRSNFWLMTHVLIITMSYSAFFLAFVIGDVLLFLFLRGEKKHKEIIQRYVRSIDRCLQIGVILLALGTILGGIWADYSWGRFWGWDPKETWALISLLAYLALLHGRLVDWVKDFGMAVGSVLMFFLVVMAWYGVNYVLGQGLHSYGFGSGGVEYVAGFALLHLVYVFSVYLLRK